MKKSAIKMIAGVSALAIFSSISATAIPAFAEEYDAIQEQDYVATFADEQTQNVANYLLENGVSMEEAQEMMDHSHNVPSFPVLLPSFPVFLWKKHRK